MGLHENMKSLLHNRWLVFVASMWVQSCSGIGYMFGSISPVIKKNMGYTQRQIAMLGVAKDIGDAIGFVAGSLCEVAPIWVVLFIGVVQNFLGYGLVWLTTTHALPKLPLWVLCVCIFVGTNGETYFNTGALVSGVQNFPKNRGPVVGILKGFAGLSGAILTQVYTIFNFPDQASVIFVVAVGPTIVITAVMFLIRPVGGHRQARQSDSTSFFFLYGVCVILAAYLLGVLILQDVTNLSQTTITWLTIGLLVLVLLPIAIPIFLVFFSSDESENVYEERLLNDDKKQEGNEMIFSEVEDEKGSEIDLLSAQERQTRMNHLQAKLVQAAADGAVRVKRRKGPRRGEDFTLMQALVKADFLLMFFSLVLASGSGLTIIDNLGQMCQSLGYENPHIFVSNVPSLFLGLKIRPCPSNNPGCVSSNPKSSSFAFPWRIPDNALDNALQQLQQAILETQKNAKIEVVEDTPDGQYLQATVDGGFGRDVLEFLVKGDVVSYRCMAAKVTYVYPFTTALGDSKGQEERIRKVVDQLGWDAPSFSAMD